VAVVGARVWIDGLTLSTFTDAQGSYQLLGVPPGSRIVHAMRLGFEVATATVVVGPSAIAVQNFLMTSAPLTYTVIATSNALVPLTVDSLRLPVPDSAIIVRRQAMSIPVVPVTGQRSLLGLFPTVTLVMDLHRITRTATGLRGSGSVATLDGRQGGTVVLVQSDNNITANVRLGLRLFQVRPQVRGIHLIVEVEQSKLPVSPSPT
jgi:hypothetical protein